MTDIPPKQTVSGMPVQSSTDFIGGQTQPPDGVSGYPGTAPGALVSIHAAALHANSDSFPVLKAFQDYLEAERQRARRRVILLSSFFFAMMVVVVAGFLTVGIMIFGRMSRTQDALLKAALKQPAETPPVAAPEAAPMTAVAAAPGTPAVDNELQKLRASLASIAKDNERMRSQMSALRQAPRPVAPVAQPAPAAAARLPAPAETQAASVAPTPVPAKPAPLALPTAAARPPPVGYADGTLFVPGGPDREPVPWRVFVPVR